MFRLCRVVDHRVGFADYIDGKVEFETISSILFFACETAISGDKMSLLRHHLAYQGETAEFGTLFDSLHIEPGLRQLKQRHHRLFLTIIFTLQCYPAEKFIWALRELLLLLSVSSASADLCPPSFHLPGLSVCFPLFPE